MGDHVPGVHVPDALLERIAAAADQKQAGQSRPASTPSMPLADIEGVAGVHVMGHKNEDVLAEIIVESGLRRQPRLQTA